MKIICPQCGFSREQKSDRLPYGQVVATCPKCGCRFRFSRADGAGEILPPKGWRPRDGEEDMDIRTVASNAYAREARRFEQEEAGAPGAAIPWDLAPAPQGWGAALWQTILLVMFQAQYFFSQLRGAGPMGRALSFFLLVCVFQTVVEWGWSQAFVAFLSQEQINDPNMAKLMEMASPGGNVFLTLLIRAGLLVLQLYVFTALMYLAYRVVARDRASFALIFQILAYGTAPWVLCLIPAIGSIVGAVWGVGCVAVGCKAAMRLTWTQTAIGFLPIIFVLLPLLTQMPGLMSA